ncbi:MAG: prepilin-type N-terminal cleavage/methylation domain-containing protein [Nitrospiraceae bacterium]|nr:prepilin-type N-terminal cleavage/methylation domain-containing protein [Nitrospiraceae bacterium]
MNKTRHVKSNKKGFTLVELLVAMAITSIVAVAIFTAFQSQQKSYLIQDQVTEMQQNLRAAMDIMVRDIRMAGYSQGASGSGITDIRPRDINNNVDVAITGNGAFKFAGDFGETISYSVYDSPVAAPDGINDLGRNSGGGRQLVAENIEALGFAYAFDAVNNATGKLPVDGILDTYKDAGGNEQVIWAIDSDGDNRLDRNLDTNGDGNIDENDGPGPGGNGLIGGTAIADVDRKDIRAVRIWMLARTEYGDKSFLNTKTYTVGNKVITPNTDADPNNDNLRMRLLETIVKCRNMVIW